MIIVLRPGTSPETRRQVEERIRGLGVEVQQKQGEANEVLLVPAGTREAEVERAIAGFEAVERCVPLPPLGSTPPPPTRRSFLDMFGIALGSLVALAVAGVSGVFFWSRGSRRART